MTIGIAIGLFILLSSFIINMWLYDNNEGFHKGMMTLIVLTLANILIEISK